MRATWLLVLLLAGCGGSSPEGPTDEQNAAVTEQVLDRVRDDARVLQLTGGYSTSLTTTGSVVIDVQVRDGTPVTEQEQLVDRIEEGLWRSTVDPVFVLDIRVSPIGAVGGPATVQRTYSRPAEFEALEQVYGPRPAD